MQSPQRDCHLDTLNDDAHTPFMPHKDGMIPLRGARSVRPSSLERNRGKEERRLTPRDNPLNLDRNE